MDLRSRLSRLIAVRVVVSTVLLGSAILIEISRPGAFPIDPFFFLIGLTYALSVVYFATLRLVNRHTWLADAQLGADALLVSGFIALTGGIVSYFSSLYFLPIIAASTIRFRRGALQVATLSALLYLGLVGGQYLGTLPDWLAGTTLQLPTLQFAQYTMAINLFGFVAVAWLAGSLAERLRSADARLVDASHEIEDLRAFNEYVIDGLLSGLVTTDAEGRVLTFNRAAATITGVPAGQDLAAVDVEQQPGLGFDGGSGRRRQGGCLGERLSERNSDGAGNEQGVAAGVVAFHLRKKRDYNRALLERLRKICCLQVSGAWGARINGRRGSGAPPCAGIRAGS